MKEVKQPKRKKHRHLFLRLAVLAFIAYVVVALVDQQIQINAKTRELESLQQQIKVQAITNEDMQRIVEAGEGENSEYIERVARESLDLSHPGERVFINMAGN